MPHAFTYRRRVEFAETDTAGVAHFAAFFRWMEEAEHAFYRSLGGAAYRWEPDRVEGMPRTSASCEYLRPVRYADELEVRLVVREKTPRAIGYEVEFRRGEGAGRAVVARGTMRVVHVTRPHGVREWRTTELPAALREAIEVPPDTPGRPPDAAGAPPDAAGDAPPAAAGPRDAEAGRRPGQDSAEDRTG